MNESSQESIIVINILVNEKMHKQVDQSCSCKNQKIVDYSFSHSTLLIIIYKLQSLYKENAMKLILEKTILKHLF